MQAQLLPYTTITICHLFLSLFGEREVMFHRSEGLISLSFIYIHFCLVLEELVAGISENLDGKKALCSTLSTCEQPKSEK